MITVAKLRSRTVKDLATLAKRKGVPGWHSMRKEELIKALVKYAKREGAVGIKRGDGQSRSEVPGTKPRSRRTQARLNQIKATFAISKDLSFGSSNGNGQSKDRLVVMVRGPFWLHVYWELTRQSVERARAALGQYWHAARPVLRLFQVDRDGTTNTVRRIVRDYEIHGGVNDWYLDVQDPPKSFQVDIGYAAPDGKFFALARSNVVTTPQAGSVNADRGWLEVARDCDRIFAMSGGYEDHGNVAELRTLLEERLHRPVGGTPANGYGLFPGRLGNGKTEFPFEVDAELVVFGATEPGAHVTIRGEPVHLQPDGTFLARFDLPDRRQVLPVVAGSPDGTEQRTIVLAIERNTKIMEPVTRDTEG